MNERSVIAVYCQSCGVYQIYQVTNNPMTLLLTSDGVPEFVYNHHKQAWRHQNSKCNAYSKPKGVLIKMATFEEVLSSIDLVAQGLEAAKEQLEELMAEFEEEEAGEDEGDVEEVELYDEDTLKAMPIADLKKLATDVYELEIEGLKRSAIVAAVLEEQKALVEAQEDEEDDEDDEDDEDLLEDLEEMLDEDEDEEPLPPVKKGKPVAKPAAKPAVPAKGKGSLKDMVSSKKTR